MNHCWNYLIETPYMRESTLLLKLSGVLLAAQRKLTQNPLLEVAIPALALILLQSCPRAWEPQLPPGGRVCCRFSLSKWQEDFKMPSSTLFHTNIPVEILLYTLCGPHHDFRAETVQDGLNWLFWVGLETQHCFYGKMF